MSSSSEGIESERRPAVFLDRDGTLNREVDFLADPAAFELLPGAGEALARLSQAGFRLCVVTNQSGIARGLLDEAVLERIHERMHADLAEHGVRVDSVNFCPHHPRVGPPAYRGDCSCRKPRPGMLIEAACRLHVDLDRSWCVGDSLRDLDAGAVLGVPGILVLTGKGEAQLSTARDRGREPTWDLDLAAAVDRILSANQRGASQH